MNGVFHTKIRRIKEIIFKCIDICSSRKAIQYTGLQNEADIRLCEESVDILRGILTFLSSCKLKPDLTLQTFMDLFPDIPPSPLSHIEGGGAREGRGGDREEGLGGGEGRTASAQSLVSSSDVSSPGLSNSTSPNPGGGGEGAVFHLPPYKNLAKFMSTLRAWWTVWDRYQSEKFFRGGEEEEEGEKKKMMIKNSHPTAPSFLGSSSCSSSSPSSPSQEGDISGVSAVEKKKKNTEDDRTGGDTQENYRATTATTAVAGGGSSSSSLSSGVKKIERGEGGEQEGEGELNSATPSNPLDANIPSSSERNEEEEENEEGLIDSHHLPHQDAPKKKCMKGGVQSNMNGTHHCLVNCKGGRDLLQQEADEGQGSQRERKEEEGGGASTMKTTSSSSSGSSSLTTAVTMASCGLSGGGGVGGVSTSRSRREKEEEEEREGWSSSHDGNRPEGVIERMKERNDEERCWSSYEEEEGSSRGGEGRGEKGETKRFISYGGEKRGAFLRESQKEERPSPVLREKNDLGEDQLTLSDIWRNLLHLRCEEEEGTTRRRRGEESVGCSTSDLSSRIHERMNEKGRGDGEHDEGGRFKSTPPSEHLWSVYTGNRRREGGREGESEACEYEEEEDRRASLLRLVERVYEDVQGRRSGGREGENKNKIMNLIRGTSKPSSSLQDPGVVSTSIGGGIGSVNERLFGEGGILSRTQHGGIPSKRVTDSQWKKTITSPSSGYDPSFFSSSSSHLSLLQHKQKQEVYLQKVLSEAGGEGKEEIFSSSSSSAGGEKGHSPLDASSSFVKIAGASSPRGGVKETDEEEVAKEDEGSPQLGGEALSSSSSYHPNSPDKTSPPNHSSPWREGREEEKEEEGKAAIVERIVLNTKETHEKIAALEGEPSSMMSPTSPPSEESRCYAFQPDGCEGDLSVSEKRSTKKKKESEEQSQLLRLGIGHASTSHDSMKDGEETFGLVPLQGDWGGQEQSALKKENASIWTLLQQRLQESSMFYYEGKGGVPQTPNEGLDGSSSSSSSSRNSSSSSCSSSGSQA
ncbi:hypothetical protein CSUI_009043 [Cystoisospora suis]|uniref:Uncharacterized protein n=1 Tax=Cystoisospora suis TaxID=483139 RepID=A0A2C6KKX2_9APIC|nr:hypothetical protein CSUI_009043 [Cystoisospora suis]